MIRNSKLGRGAYGTRYDDDLYATDPRSTTALELRDFAEEANSRLPGRGSEPGRDKGVEVAATYVMSKTNLDPFNSHTGVFIIPDDGNPEGRYLYDPSGHYMTREIGNGRALSGPEFSPEDYLQYHLNGGSNVTVRKFNTTPEEEAEITKRAEGLGGGGSIDCTTNVTKAIRGIGPFDEVEETRWPFVLNNQLRELGKHVGETNNLQGLRHLLGKKGRVGVNK